MKLMLPRKIIEPFFMLGIFAILLICLVPQASAQRVRSTVRRVQIEQRRRNSQVIEQAARWRREHEQRRLKQKRREEQQRRVPRSKFQIL